MKNRLLQVALKCILVLQILVLSFGGILAILDALGKKDLSNKIVNWLF